MISNYTPNSTLTTVEKFFVEKMLELFYRKTLDSHRAKLNNPKWVLHELSQVLFDLHTNHIKSFEKTITPVIHEALRFIDNDDTLSFNAVNKKYFKELLGKADAKNYLHLSHAVKVVLESNKQYTPSLFLKIKNEINELNSKQKLELENFNQLSILSDYLATDLINIGYSKNYLYTNTAWIFSNSHKVSFNDCFQWFCNLSIKAEEEFTVIFKLIKFNQNEEVDIKSPFEIKDSEIESYSDINKHTRAFFEKKNKDKSKHYYLAIKRSDKDYLSVIEEAKKELFNLIDLLHLGYPDTPFGFYKSCLVIGSIKPHLARLQPVYYFVDGAYKSDSNLYNSLVEKIKRLSENQKIQKESLQKIISAFRHLRLARDADELEQKFINYWIGLEYIFSNYDADENTIARLKLYFVHAHSIVYIKRNLFEYYQDIQRLKLLDSIPTYKSDNLDFLLLEETYDFIIENYTSTFPLLAFRAKKYKRLLSDKKNLIDIINRHRSNLEWHLVRCYRIRNEIIHDAAIHLNIEMITNNLRYYLTFILNALIDYLDVTPDVNLDGNLSINDYFLLQEIRFRSLAIEEFNINLLMNEKSVTEVFSN